MNFSAVGGYTSEPESQSFNFCPLMKSTLIFTLILVAEALSARTWTHINPILGDQSYILKYGEAPTPSTNDQVRIATHLEYAEFVLRSKDVYGMSEEHISKRTHLLDLLHEYRTRGIFPNNSDETDERRPCFIDHNGTICAVGYLIEQTAGHDVAELISERFLYNEIMEMNDPLVINWIENCGLTREECAMIQPGYGSDPIHEPQLSYGVSYRVGDNFYHSFGIYNLKYAGDGHWGSGRGDLSRSTGFRFDLLNNGNFSAGIRHAQALRRPRDEQKFAYLALMPECFRYNKVWGMNLKPELEFTRTIKFLELGLGYSYAIPIISASSYGAGRHDIQFRVGINISDIEIPKRPKREKSGEATDA